MKGDDIMKVYRYMSFREFQLVTSGVELVYNSNRWAGARTSSQGYCFLGEDTTVRSSVERLNPETDELEEAEPVEFDPIGCYSFLAGIVSKDVLVEFEVTKTSNLQESSGVYADPFGGWSDYCEVTEYCTQSYSRDSLVPTKYTCDFKCCGAFKDRKWWDIG